MKYIILTAVIIFSNTLIILSNITNAFAQKGEYEFISDDEYEVIRDYYSNRKDGNKARLYHRTYFDKGWATFFYTTKYLKSESSFPVTISDTELDSILTEKRLSKIVNAITNAVPSDLDKNKLGDNIKLQKSFDSRADLKNRVLRISKPIIVDDIAIFKKITLNVSTIHVMRRKQNRWEIIYTSNEYAILE